MVAGAFAGAAGPPSHSGRNNCLMRGRGRRGSRGIATATVCAMARIVAAACATDDEGCRAHGADSGYDSRGVRGPGRAGRAGDCKAANAAGRLRFDLQAVGRKVVDGQR